MKVTAMTALVKVRQMLKTGLEPIINNEDTRQALSLILGRLSSYTYESEENRRLSCSDDLLTAGSSVANDPVCFSGASDALLANLPFSAVTMDTLVTTQSHMEDKNSDQTEDACPRKVKKMPCPLKSSARSLKKPVLK